MLVEVEKNWGEEKMPKPISFGEIGFNLVSSMEETPDGREQAGVFRIAVLGDFSGRGSRGLMRTGRELATLQPVFVDRDCCDAVMAQLGVEIRLDVLGDKAPPVRISFAALDDFHPDRLFRDLEVFQAMRESRKILLDPASFAARDREPAAAVPSPQAGSVTSAEVTKAALSDLGGANLLDQILEQDDGRAASAASGQSSSEWDFFLRRLVSPYLVSAAHPEQEEMIGSMDAATEELMRRILHHPDFQAMEAAWQGLWFLISRLETDAALKVYLLDISRQELAADLMAGDDLQVSGLYRLLVEQGVQTFGGAPWSLLTGLYDFGVAGEDPGILGRMANLARVAGAPFVAAANDTLLGCRSLAATPDPDDWQPLSGGEQAAWAALRSLLAASSLGLGLPRFLLRLPYGEKTDPIDSFAFEEMAEPPQHGHYLWGNPALAVALVLGASFSRNGWRLFDQPVFSIDGLPLHVFRHEGEATALPCAEVLLTERAVDAILDRGLMPLLSFRNQDTIRLARFQSVADPLTRLSGPWQ
jgi:type VI secretion system protein ImpC